VIFGLLIPYIHREGGIGHQARDAMLLCMSLSKKNDALGKYIAEHSNICPVSVLFTAYILNMQFCLAVVQENFSKSFFHLHKSSNSFCFFQDQMQYVKQIHIEKLVTSRKIVEI
jgi:hypothetical protein